MCHYICMYMYLRASMAPSSPSKRDTVFLTSSVACRKCLLARYCCSCSGTAFTFSLTGTRKENRMKKCYDILLVLNDLVPYIVSISLSMCLKRTSSSHNLFNSSLLQRSRVLHDCKFFLSALILSCDSIETHTHTKSFLKGRYNA